MVTSLDNSLPAWIRAASVLGVPSLIALGLAWWITMTLATSLVRVEVKLDHHEIMRAHDMQLQNAFLYAICLNVAEGNVQPDIARARCAIALDGALAASK